MKVLLQCKSHTVQLFVPQVDLRYTQKQGRGLNIYVRNFQVNLYCLSCYSMLTRRASNIVPSCSSKFRKQSPNKMMSRSTIYVTEHLLCEVLFSVKYWNMPD